jgi:hypothetical protein
VRGELGHAGGAPRRVLFAAGLYALGIYEILGRFEGQSAQLSHILSCCEIQGDMPFAIWFLERSLDNFGQAGFSEKHPMVMKFQCMLAAAKR